MRSTSQDLAALIKIARAQTIHYVLKRGQGNREL
jgi:hypothetical protein